MNLKGRLGRLERESGYFEPEILDMSHLTERELELIENVTNRAIEEDVDLGDVKVTPEEQAAFDAFLAHYTEAKHGA